MDFAEYVGRIVYVRIKRRGATREHKGKLSEFSKAEICLLNRDGRRIWIPKPNQFSDEIHIIKETESYDE